MVRKASSHVLLWRIRRPVARIWRRIPDVVGRVDNAWAGLAAMRAPVMVARCSWREKQGGWGCGRRRGSLRPMAPLPPASGQEGVRRAGWSGRSARSPRQVPSRQVLIAVLIAPRSARDGCQGTTAGVGALLARLASPSPKSPSHAPTARGIANSRLIYIEMCWREAVELCLCLR